MLVFFFPSQFFLRRQVLSLYREILRTVREVSNEDHRKELADWARSEFKKNKHEKDEVTYTKISRNIAIEMKRLQGSPEIGKDLYKNRYIKCACG